MTEVGDPSEKKDEEQNLHLVTVTMFLCAAASLIHAGWHKCTLRLSKWLQEHFGVCSLAAKVPDPDQIKNFWNKMFAAWLCDEVNLHKSFEFWKILAAHLEIFEILGGS